MADLSQLQHGAFSTRRLARDVNNNALPLAQRNAAFAQPDFAFVIQRQETLVVLQPKIEKHAATAAEMKALVKKNWPVRVEGGEAPGPKKGKGGK